MILGLLLFILALPKIWRVTPPGFQPVVRGSLVDFAQAWSLANEGRRQMKAGDYPKAARSYFAAWKNNLGKIELLRHALRAFVRSDVSPQSNLSQQARDYVRWLLLLSSTNQSDLFLAARVYDILGDSGSVLRLLEPLEKELPKNLYGAMAKAAFDSDDTTNFVRWWQQAGEQLKKDPPLALYYAAWCAGWGPDSGEASALRKLQTAAKRLDQRLLANRLLLKVYRHRRNIESYQATLELLGSFQGDRLSDHVNYWLMLKAVGKGAAALQLARRYPYPPRTALEVAGLGQVFAKLGDLHEAPVALLIARQRPDKAAYLTLDFLNQHPQSTLARLDHARALAQMGRSAEAERLLRGLKATRPEMRNSLACIWLQISVNRHDTEGVKAALAHIDEHLLFPTQRRWVASVRQQFGLSSPK